MSLCPNGRKTIDSRTGSHMVKQEILRAKTLYQHKTRRPSPPDEIIISWIPSVCGKHAYESMILGGEDGIVKTNSDEFKYVLHSSDWPYHQEDTPSLRYASLAVMGFLAYKIFYRR